MTVLVRPRLLKTSKTWRATSNKSIRPTTKSKTLSSWSSSKSRNSMCFRRTWTSSSASMSSLKCSNQRLMSITGRRRKKKTRLLAVSRVKEKTESRLIFESSSASHWKSTRITTRFSFSTKRPNSCRNCTTISEATFRKSKSFWIQSLMLSKTTRSRSRQITNCVHELQVSLGTSSNFSYWSWSHSTRHLASHQRSTRKRQKSFFRFKTKWCLISYRYTSQSKSRRSLPLYLSFSNQMCLTRLLRSKSTSANSWIRWILGSYWNWKCRRSILSVRWKWSRKWRKACSKNFFSPSCKSTSSCFETLVSHKQLSWADSRSWEINNQDQNQAENCKQFSQTFSSRSLSRSTSSYFQFCAQTILLQHSTRFRQDCTWYASSTSLWIELGQASVRHSGKKSSKR